MMAAKSGGGQADTATELVEQESVLGLEELDGLALAARPCPDPGGSER